MRIGRGTHLTPFFTRSETFVQPSEQVSRDLDAKYDSPIYGNMGPIFNTFPDIYGPLDKAWARTYETLKLGIASDPRDGLALGGYTNLFRIWI